jgi:hypothetical protein
MNLRGNDLLWVWLIGARGGFMPLSFPSIFDDSIAVLAVDAGDECAGVNLELSDGRKTNALVRRKQSCIAGSVAYRTFHDRKCPFASGMSQLDPYFLDWSVFGNGVCDYVLSDAHELAGKKSFRTTTLDLLFGEEDSYFAPSIIVLDAQGASAEILLTGADMALSHADALILEVETIPFFGGKASFAQLLPSLWDRGFVFVRFLDEEETWATPHRLPIGQRSAALPGARDAVFVRLPDRRAERQKLSRLCKYVVSCCICGRIDFALHALGSLPEALLNRLVCKSTLELMVKSLYAASRGMPVAMPTKWVASDEAKPRMNDQCIESLKQLAKDDETPLEKILLAYGFVDLQKDLKERRIRQARACLTR